ncbi:hypothetical protein L4D76_21360 [Photobacterium sagamiensis]|uniref:hypothetical protein n=1 Tax=Photobacterium sagamiensis TaxID=2910241 RepID=UPI003D0C01B4
MTDNTEKTIYNCHIHLFTHENVPNKFLPFLLVPAARCEPFRRLLTLAMEVIIPWSERDIFHRSANFINVAYSDSQEDIPNQLEDADLST